jgi:hypothetical protein
MNATYECLPTGARLQVIPSPVEMTVGQSRTMTISVKPGPAQVNGVTVNAAVDPAHLRLVDMNVIDVFDQEFERTFDPLTGQFAYSGGALGAVITQPFDLLTLTVEAVEPTPATYLSFLSGFADFPPTDISGPEGSVLERAEPGVITIDADRLRAAVDLQGRPDKPADAWAVPLTVWLTPSGSLTSAYTMTTTTDRQGQFTLNLLNVAPGSYDIGLKNSHTLRSLAQGVNLIDGENDYSLGRLLEGDVEKATSYNAVVQADFEAFTPAFNTCDGETSFLADADLDESGCVLIPDFGLLSGNFGQIGDILVTATPGLLAGETAQIQAAATTVEAGATLSFGERLKAVKAGEVIEVPVVLETQAAINGVSLEINFDPDAVEILNADWTGELPFVLQKPAIDPAGQIRYAAGLIGQTWQGALQVGTLTLRIKEGHTTSTLSFQNTFKITDVSSPAGSVLTQAQDLSLVSSQYDLFLPVIVR